MKLMDTIKGIFSKIKYSTLENSYARKYWYMEFLVIGLLIVVLILHFTDNSSEFVNISVKSNLEIIKESNSTNHNLFYKNGAYRVEFSYFDSSIVLLGYRDSNDKWLLDSKSMMFRDVNSSDTLFFDPLLFSEDIENFDSFEKEKKVSINNIKARLLRMSDSLKANIEIINWEKFDFPLSIKFQSDSFSFESKISDIIDTTMENSFFIVPSNYEYSDTFSSRFYKYIRPILNTEKTVTAPCGITLGQSGKLTVNTDFNKEVSITIASNEKPAIVTYFVTKSDSIHDDSLKTIVLEAEDFLTLDIKQVTSLVFNTNETVDIIIDQFERTENGSYYEYFVMPGVIRHLECLPNKKASVLIESKGQDHLESDFMMKVVYFKNDNRRKEDYSVSLDDGEVKLWEFDIDRSLERIIISMSNSGGVIVIIDQR